MRWWALRLVGSVAIQVFLFLCALPIRIRSCALFNTFCQAYWIFKYFMQKGKASPERDEKRCLQQGSQTQQHSCGCLGLPQGCRTALGTSTRNFPIRGCAHTGSWKSPICQGVGNSNFSPARWRKTLSRVLLLKDVNFGLNFWVQVKLCKLTSGSNPGRGTPGLRGYICT